MTWLQSGVLDPQGPVGRSELTVLFNATAIMLAVIVPVIVLTLAFAWWFRASNSRALYRPDWSYSGQIELVVWSIPALVILFLGGITWLATHELDPRKPLASDNPSLTVQVVSLDWKWLFIYPERRVASINRLVIPAGTPVRFQLTSASVMNSFFVPQLGSQIYTMAGMATELNLQADQAGSFRGFSAQFSGDGFSSMRFVVDALPEAAFNDWLATAEQSPDRLDRTAYDDLAKPSSALSRKTYRDVASDLFARVINPTEQQATSGEDNICKSEQARAE